MLTLIPAHATHKVIPAYRLPDIQAKMARLTKHAARLNVPAPTLQVCAPHMERYTQTVIDDGDATTYTRHLESVEVVVTYLTTIVIAGWTLEAVISVGDVENVVTRLDDTGLYPSEWRTVRGTRCDHCNVRQHRVKLLAIRHEDGHRMIVGAQCARDFLGGYDIDAALTYAACLDDIRADQDDDDRERHAHSLDDVTDYVTCAVASIRVDGWHPADAPYPTRDRAMSVMDRRKGEPPPTPADRSQAIAIVEWASTLADDGGYLGNLRALALNGAMRPNQRGLAASMPRAYERAIAQQADDAAAPTDKGHLGAIKQRLVVTGTVTGTFTGASDFGVYCWVKVTTDDGHRVEWKATTSWPETGDRITGKATVTEHGEYRGHSVTRVNRWAWAPAPE